MASQYEPLGCFNDPGGTKKVETVKSLQECASVCGSATVALKVLSQSSSNIQCTCDPDLGTSRGNCVSCGASSEQCGTIKMGPISDEQQILYNTIFVYKRKVASLTTIPPITTSNQHYTTTLVPLTSEPPGNATSQPKDDASGPGFPITGIAGIVVGFLILTALIVVAFLVRRRQKLQGMDAKEANIITQANNLGGTHMSNQPSQPPHHPAVAVFPLEPFTEKKSAPLFTSEPPVLVPTPSYVSPPRISKETEMYQNLHGIGPTQNQLPGFATVDVFPPREDGTDSKAAFVPTHLTGGSQSAYLKSPLGLPREETVADVASWSTEDVGRALAEAGVAPAFIAMLMNNKINGYEMQLLTNERLEAMGVLSEAAKHTILFVVGRLSGQAHRPDQTVVPLTLPAYHD
ncbi:hypothetical protein HDU97_010039 [Phlyctochytrium planicorne]|nr:hypothetical protein HDU97_010039 [Phlyctochytrium planicorne]